MYHKCTQSTNDFWQNSRLTTRLIIFWKNCVSLLHSDMRNFLKTVLSSDNTKIDAVESKWSDQTSESYDKNRQIKSILYFYEPKCQFSKGSKCHHGIIPSRILAPAPSSVSQCKRYKVLLYLYWGSWLSTKKQKGQHNSTLL